MTQRTSAVDTDGFAEPFAIEEVPWEEFCHGERFKSCRYLMPGNPQPHDVMVYTESGRVHAKLMGDSYPKTPTMDYWEGVQV